MSPGSDVSKALPLMSTAVAPIGLLLVPLLLGRGLSSAAGGIAAAAETVAEDEDIGEDLPAADKDVGWMSV